LRDENDISAKEEIKGKSSRLPRQNEHCRRQKGISSKKIKGKKEVVSLGRVKWPFFLNSPLFWHIGIPVRCFLNSPLFWHIGMFGMEEK
jgi:hypothetical protein